MLARLVPLSVTALVSSAATLLAVHLLFGAPQRMHSSSDGWGNYGARYIVGKDRFSWFHPSRANCWGGHTLDGRCITLVSSSGLVKGVEDKPQHYSYPPVKRADWKLCKHGVVGTFEKPCWDSHPDSIKRKAFLKRLAADCGSPGHPVNPLYVEAHGHCPPFYTHQAMRGDPEGWKSKYPIVRAAYWVETGCRQDGPHSVICHGTTVEER